MNISERTWMLYRYTRQIFNFILFKWRISAGPPRLSRDSRPIMLGLCLFAYIFTNKPIVSTKRIITDLVDFIATIWNVRKKVCSITLKLIERSWTDVTKSHVTRDLMMVMLTCGNLKFYNRYHYSQMWIFVITPSLKIQFDKLSSRLTEIEGACKANAGLKSYFDPSADRENEARDCTGTCCMKSPLHASFSFIQRLTQVLHSGSFQSWSEKW